MPAALRISSGTAGFLTDGSGHALGLFTGDLVLFAGTRVAREEPEAGARPTHREALWSCPTSNAIMQHKSGALDTGDAWQKIALELYYETRVKALPAAPANSNTLKNDARNFKRRFIDKFATNKYQVSNNQDFFQGAVLDLGFCLERLGTRRQLGPRQYQLLRSHLRAPAGASRLADVHGAAFIQRELGDARQTPIRDVDTLVGAMFDHMRALNSKKRSQLYPLLTTKKPARYDQFALLLAQVCDVMFPAGAQSLEQLARGLMAALVGDLRRTHARDKVDQLWTRTPAGLNGSRLQSI